MLTNLNPYLIYIIRRDWMITHNTMEYHEHWKKRMKIYNKLARLIKKRSVIG